MDKLFSKQTLIIKKLFRVYLFRAGCLCWYYCRIHYVWMGQFWCECGHWFWSHSAKETSSATVWGKCEPKFLKAIWMAQVSNFYLICIELILILINKRIHCAAKTMSSRYIGCLITGLLLLARWRYLWWVRLLLVWQVRKILHRSTRICSLQWYIGNQLV